MNIEVVEDKVELAALLELDRETHVYGLGDLEEPYWSSSTWFRSGVAVVGIISTGGDWVAGYAMSRSHPEETLQTLLEVQAHLPPGTWVTGPIGLDDALSAVRPVDAKGVHHRMILREHLDRSPDRGVVRLGPADLDRLSALLETATEPVFFLPAMLSGGVFVGIDRAGSLTAAAGTHVMSETHSIAAVGTVFTHPDHRGQGLGTRVVTGLCERLRHRARTIGLNVSKSNDAARHLYERVGFRVAFEYEEVQVL